jgi:hypothetical protein
MICPTLRGRQFIPAGRSGDDGPGFNPAPIASAASIRGSSAILASAFAFEIADLFNASQQASVARRAGSFGPRSYFASAASGHLAVPLGRLSGPDPQANHFERFRLLIYRPPSIPSPVWSEAICLSISAMISSRVGISVPCFPPSAPRTCGANEPRQTHQNSN